MIKSFVLLASIIATSFSSTAQTEEILPYRIPVIQNTYQGCCSGVRVMSESDQVSPLPTSIEKNDDALDITDPELFHLAAAPNPTKGYVSVSVSAIFIGHNIQIMDMSGRFVGAPVPITGPTVNLNIEGESGMYFLSIRTEKEIFTERILLDK